MAYVYQHIRLDTNEVFYIGVAKRKGRASDKNGRNKYWHHVVNKAGYSINIIAENLSYKSALQLEKNLINTIGRRDLGLGPLVNMTDGGEGSLGNIQSEKTRSKRRYSMHGKNSRPCSEETRKKISKKRTMSIEDFIIKYGEEEGRSRYETNQRNKYKKFTYSNKKDLKWINNSQTNKRVKLKDFDSYIKNGWIEGRLEKTIQNIKKSLINKTHISGYHHKIVKCPHCLKEGGQANMGRYHFNNCKSLNN